MLSVVKSSKQPRSPVAAALSTCTGGFAALALLSGVINVLTLTGSLFMMQVYDRVLASRSLPTLAALSAIAIGAYVFQGVLDILRARVLALVGEKVDAEVGPELHAAAIELPLRLPRGSHDAMLPFRDLDAIRSFLAGPGPLALFDLPWIPIYLTVAFLLHPLLGFLITAGALLLIGLTILTEFKGKEPLKKAHEAQSVRNLAAEAAQRAPEVVKAMGLLPALAHRWAKAHEIHLLAQRRASFVVGRFSGISKMSRMILQSSVLGLGAYLAIRGEMSGGSIIACSILSSRALGPVDQAISGWKAFVAARQGYSRLKHFFALVPAPAESFKLPAPGKCLAVQNISVSPPGQTKTTVRRLSFQLEAGQALGILGPSASGKSTLARALIGVWSLQSGKVLLDGASIDQWETAALGPSIGYLPQDIQLFDGSVAENIARFEENADPAHVIAAAEAAGFHNHVLSLSEGYETRVGDGGSHLSAGQKQRLGLARALYRAPFLVVLDEPNSNLDAEGEEALTRAIHQIRARRGIVVVIAHRPSAIAAVDMLLVIKNGEAIAFGPRDEVLAKTVRNAGVLRMNTGTRPSTAHVGGGVQSGTLANA